MGPDPDAICDHGGVGGINAYVLPLVKNEDYSKINECVYRFNLSLSSAIQRVLDLFQCFSFGFRH